MTGPPATKTPNAATRSADAAARRAERPAPLEPWLRVGTGAGDRLAGGVEDTLDFETKATAASPAAVRQAPRARRDFDDRFERCFDRVWAYVSQRTGSRARCERIVDQVLESTLELLVSPGARDESQQMRLLRAASDRLLGEVNGTRAATGDGQR